MTALVASTEFDVFRIGGAAELLMFSLFHSDLLQGGTALFTALPVNP